ncbi:MAG: heme A synthase [Rhodothermales bacterium]
MKSSAFRAESLPVSSSMRQRYIFTLVTLFATVILLAWGAVVTSIEAGLAVPDWPTTFDSMDPVNPTPGWYKIPEVLAEHGHRVMGMIVGALTLILALWTLIADPRSWMKKVAVLALLLVIVQGVLGGLRVLWISLDMAVVHACLAQLFFATMAALALFTSPSWLKADHVLPDNEASAKLRRIALLTGLILYGQIILGAILRHPGEGSDPALAGMHMLGAGVVFAFVFLTIKAAKKADPEKTSVLKMAHGLAGILTLQIILGFIAYVVILQDADTGRGIFQVVLNSAHMVVGALFFASTVALILVSARKLTSEPAT